MANREGEGPKGSTKNDSESADRTQTDSSRQNCDRQSTNSSDQVDSPAVSSNALNEKMFRRGEDHVADSEATGGSSSSSDDHNNRKISRAKVVAQNKALLSENEKLQAKIREYEIMLANKEESEHKTRQPPSNTSIENDDEKDEGGSVVATLKGKIKSLKTKRRQEKLTIMQMQKNVEAHEMEIEGLQRELNRTVTELERVQKLRAEDKTRTIRLNKQVVDVTRQLQESSLREEEASQRVERLEAELQKRDGELEVTLELLQSKVERILQLERELEMKKEGLATLEKQIGLLRQRWGQQVAANASIDFLQVQEECKMLRRHNLVLKLVVEELQEARRQRRDSDIDIDSVFMKLPKEIQGDATVMSIARSAMSSFDSESKR